LVKNKFYSNGGRVLCITARSTTLENARRIVYKTIKAINWKNGFYRKDIGIKNK
jgi:phosphoribosylamine--glycine ligase